MTSKQHLSDFAPEAAIRAKALSAEFAPGDRTFASMMRRRAAAQPDLPLVTCGGQTLTLGSAEHAASGWAGMLAAQGIRKGDRVALLCSNRMEFLLLYMGCAWLGAIAVPINTASRGMQLQHILSNSGARLLFVEPDLLSHLDSVDRSVLPLEQVIPIAGLTPGDPVPPGDAGPGAPVAVLYTSGTTGLSKGVLCPQAQYFWWGLVTGRQLGVVPGDVLHTTLPLFHTNALNCFYQALLYQAHQVVAQRFSVSGFWRDLADSGATVTYLLGAMVPMLMSKPATPADRAHNVRVALAPGVPGNFHADFTARTGITLLDGYGSTETNFTIASGVTDRRAGAMGRVVAGFQARVVDEDDAEVPDGTAGELVMRADEPYAFALGYLGMPDKTVEAWRNLWFHSGDRVVRDPDGQFRFIDRMKDAIRRRGENISSFEVEQVLQSHPAVGTAAVFPVASDLAEDEVMAALILKEGAQVSGEELIRFCEPRMSYFSVPRYLDFREDLPRTENGKIQKFKLREEGITGSTWDRVAAGVEVKR